MVAAGIMMILDTCIMIHKTTFQLTSILLLYSENLLVSEIHILFKNIFTTVTTQEGEPDFFIKPEGWYNFEEKEKVMFIAEVSE